MHKWSSVSLDKLCTFEKGRTGLAKAIPGDYPLVTTALERKSCENYQFDTKAVCIPLVSSTGHGHASLKNVHYQEGKFALGSILVALISKDEKVLNTQFLHLYLSKFKDTVLVPLMSGAANVSLSISKIKKLEIPLPSIERQIEIVELFNNIIEEKNELDKEIENQKTYLKELKQSILQDAIEGKLTTKWREKNPNIESAKELLEKIALGKEQLIKEKKIKKQKPLASISEDEIPFNIPKSWEWTRLDDILDNFIGGNAYKSTDFIKYSSNQVLRLGNIRPFTLRLESKPVFISDDLAEMSLPYKISLNDILITMTGTRGKKDYCYTVMIEDSDLSNKNLFLNQRLGCFRFNSNIIYKFYDIVMKNEILLNEIYKTATGSANQANIGSKALKLWIVPLPPLEEQKQIVKEVEKLFKLCDSLEEQIFQNKIYAEQLMQSILKEAFEDKTQKENLVDEKLDKEIEISEDEIKQIFEECFIDKKVSSRRRQQSNNNHYMSKMIISDDLYGKSKNIRHIKLRKLLSKLYERFRDAEDIYVSTQLPIVGKYIRLLISGYSLYQDIDELATIKITPEQSLCLIVLNFYTYQLKEADGATNYEILKALETSYKKYVDKYKLDEQEIENILNYLQKIHLVDKKDKKWIIKEEVRREFK